MFISKIKNVLSRGSLMLGAFALIGSMGCAAEELGNEELAAPAAEEVAASESELTNQYPYCYQHDYVDQYNEWKIYGNDNGQWISPYKWYEQQDRWNNKYLKTAHRDPGVDLYYYAGGEWPMQYQTYDHDYVKYGYKFAIYVRGRGYLHYSQQPYSYGYDLTFQDQPSYEWSIPGHYGQYVPKNEWVSFYNDYAYSYMVYCNQPYGIDLSWANECHEYDYKRYDQNYCY
jgi:hypothetical protein